VVPAPVLAELKMGEIAGFVPVVDWSWIDQAQLSPSERARSEELGRRFGLGESACIAVAETRGGFLLTDDLGARRLATASGLTVTGTLGILERLIRTGNLSLNEADELLTQMIGRGYRSPVRSLRAVISEP
jgi:predicted nucleic acid-binding protein